MKYDKCPLCELNYKLTTENMCDVCKNHCSSPEDDDYICPICFKNKLEYDEVICKKCREKNILDNLGDYLT